MSEGNKQCRYKNPITNWQCPYETLQDSKEGFCIFHERRKDKDIEKFNAGIKKILHDKDSDAYHFEGFIFPDSISFVKFEFKKSVYFSEANFSGVNTDFSESKFWGENTDFNGTQFPSEKTAFMKANFFSEKTNFREVRFTGQAAYFGWAEFLGRKTDFGQARFSGETTDFNFARFCGELICFSKAEFSGEDLYFTGATFLGITEFKHAKFSRGKTNFSGAEFSGKQTYFSGAQFLGSNVDFAQAKFLKGYTYFNGAKFTGENTDFSRTKFREANTDFGGSTFSGRKVVFNETEFSSDNTDFSSAEFSGEEVNFGDCQFLKTILFHRTIFKAKLSFTRVDLRKCVFTEVDLKNVDFSLLDWDWNYRIANETQLGEPLDRLFPKTHKLYFNTGEIYRQLKVQFNEKRDFAKARMFHFREQECKRKACKLPRESGEWIWLWILKLSCGYGEKLRNVLISSIVLIFVFAFSYMLLGLHRRDVVSILVFKYDFSFEKLPYITTILKDFLTSLMFSLKGFFPLWRFQQYKLVGDFANLVAGFQFLLGAFFVGLFIYVFRRRMEK